MLKSRSLLQAITSNLGDWHIARTLWLAITSNFGGCMFEPNPFVEFMVLISDQHKFVFDVPEMDCCVFLEGLPLLSGDVSL